MVLTPAELVARTNRTIAALLAGVPEGHPLGVIGPDFLRRLRQRPFVLDDTGEIHSFTVDRHRNAIYLDSGMVTGLQETFARYCTAAATSHVARSDLSEVDAAETDAFTAAMLDMFFLLFLMHETLHETQALTSYNYHQTDSFTNSIRTVDYAADRLSILSIAQLLARSETDWTQALTVKSPPALVLRLIQAHCFGMAHFAQLGGGATPTLTKPGFYRMTTWHLQFHRASALTRQGRDPLPVLAVEPVFDVLACDRLNEARPFSADRLLGKIEDLREENPPPENMSILIQPPHALPILKRFNGSSPGSLENLVRGVYACGFAMTEPFLFELFDAVPALLAIDDTPTPAAPTPPLPSGSPAGAIAIDGTGLARIEVTARQPATAYSRRFWGDPNSTDRSLQTQAEVMEVARRLPACETAVRTIFRIFDIASARGGYGQRTFATGVRLIASVKVSNPSDGVALLHIPEQPERAIPGPAGAERILYRVVASQAIRLDAGQSDLLALEISVSFDVPDESRWDDLHQLGLLELGLAKTLRDRLTEASRRDGALPIVLDIVDMDGGARQVPIQVQIVDAPQALPAWDFDFAQIAAAFQTIDTAAVPAYREQQKAELQALMKENEALQDDDEKGDARPA